MGLPNPIAQEIVKCFSDRVSAPAQLAVRTFFARKRRLKRQEPWSAGSLLSCVLHRCTDRLFRRRKTDLRALDSLPYEPDMTGGSMGVGAEGRKAIVKHFPCALLASSAINSALSKAKNLLQPPRVFPSQESPRDKVRYVFALSARAVKVCPCSLQEALGLTGRSLPSSRLTFNILVACEARERGRSPK